MFCVIGYEFHMKELITFGFHTNRNLTLIDFGLLYFLISDLSDDGFSLLDLDDAEFQFALGADEGIVNLFTE